MDCRRAWNTMMKSFDEDIPNLYEKELNSHFDGCSLCKTRFEKLNEAFTVLKTTDMKAPPDIEKKVMAELNFVKHKRDFLLQYVIFNLIVFVGIVVAWVDNVYTIGIYTFVKEVFSEVVAAYNTSATVFAAFRNFSNTYFIKPTTNIIIIAVLIYGILNIVLSLQKMCRRHFSVR